MLTKDADILVALKHGGDRLHPRSVPEPESTPEHRLNLSGDLVRLNPTSDGTNNISPLG